MAFISHPVSSTGNFFSAILRSTTEVFKTIGAFLVANPSLQARIDRIEYLQSLSDAELSKKGIRRDDIVYHVMHDLFYH